jgi:transcription elongation GreA/GreB family factor
MLDVARRPAAAPGWPITLAAAPGWPITQAAKEALEAEIRSLEAELARDDLDVTRGAHADELAVHRIDRARSTRRLEQLRSLCEDVQVEPDDGLAVIGRRVAILDDEDVSSTYSLVLPGEGDPARGWLSIDSPVGLAVLGRRAGDRAVVRAPGGDWPILVLAVE